MKNKSIYILGAGSIGLLWACRLAEQNHVPVLVVREEFGKATVIRHFQDQTAHFNFETRCAPLHETIEFLFITTKAHQTQAAVNALKSVISPHAIIVLLQNGMGNGEWLATEFPDANIFLGTTTDGVFRQNKLEFTLAGLGETYFGPGSTNAKKEDIQVLLNCAANTFWDDVISARLWQKLAINCVINPLAALYECRNGELVTNTQYFHHFCKVAEETQAAFNELGIPLPQASLLDFAKSVAEKTAHNINSMLADKRTGRGTEIDFILGYLLSKVQAAHYPELQGLYQSIHSLTSPH